MKVKTIIIGGGIVGSTAAYYLARQGHPVLLFDEGVGQATSASAGIICPWFSLRRNKPWYFLVSQGAEFYRQFMTDLQADRYSTAHIFKESGAIFIRRTQKRVEQDLAAADEKLSQSPSIQEVRGLTAEDIQTLAPFIDSDYPGLYVKGGARVDGQALIKTLHQAIEAHGGQIIRERVTLTKDADSHVFVQSSQETYYANHILLSVGPHLTDLLSPLGYQVDIHPQKGQLFTVDLPVNIDDSQFPVVIPFGVGDIIPMNDGSVTIGATHEDEEAFNLDVDWETMGALKEEALTWMPSLIDLPVKSTRVGTRAHTSDFSVLVGDVPGLNQVTAISGLGSSGLTSGPFLGYQYAQKVLHHSWQIDPNLYPIQDYIACSHSQNT